MQYQKVKSVAKDVTVKGPRLSKLVLETMATIATIVGDTLGPGGRQVMIERYEHGIPPMVTKDGVTVFRSLGFTDPAQHCIMEAARDAASRTASEAGDGTTTATILAEAIVRLTDDFCTHNRRMSPQKVVRYLESQFRDVIEPAIQELSIKVDSSTEEGQRILRSVAKISANGDEPLADAVMQCFELVGDDGNVTISEVSGESSYEVEALDGYPIPMGYEESCPKFYPKLVNDPGTQSCKMDNPVFVLYHGTLTDVTTAYTLLAKVGDQFELLIQGEQTEYRHPFVVFVATGFSETVLATFAAGWTLPNSLKVFPLTIPKSPLFNAQVQFLEDLSAVTGANVFDPINKPLDTGGLEDLGPGVTSFEATRFRSTIIGRAASQGVYWEDRLMEQIAAVQQQLEAPESELDKLILQERLGKLTGGIAKLKVIGASNGELKEKRDRAEDAVCAVRGAIKHGCLPGGGWGLLKIASLLDNSPINTHVLKQALLAPVFRLFLNAGYTGDETRAALEPILLGIKNNETIVFDLMNERYGSPVDIGVLDSTPAVREAVRNSLSIAALLGTLGGTVVFARDSELERTEALATAAWIRDANTSEANERA